MGTFGGGPTFGGPGGGGADVGVPFSSLCYAAYRIAGINVRQAIQPSTDMYYEAIPEFNRIIDQWNIEGTMIFNSAILQFPMDGRKIYTIGGPGLGADFDVARPIYYKMANMVYPSSPPIYEPMAILDDEQYAQITLQDIAGAPAYVMYPDMAYPLTNIYLVPQPPQGYQLQLYVWQSLAVVGSKDDLVTLPPGYERMIVYTLAEAVAALNPSLANMSPASYKIARGTRDSVRQNNTRSPKIYSPPEYTNGGRAFVNYLSGLNQ